MHGFSKLKSMALTDAEMDEMEMPIPIDRGSRSRYPYGLRIVLTERELEKLGIDKECNVGDFVDFRAFARVTSYSEESTTDGDKCRVELQIEDISYEAESNEMMGEGEY